MGGRSVGERAVKDKRRARLKKSFGKWMEMQTMGVAKPRDYPECAASMKDCPPAIEYPNNPPDCCRLCPQYIESKFYHERNPQERARELAELFAGLRKKGPS